MKRIILAAVLPLLVPVAQTALCAWDKFYHWGDLPVEACVLDRMVWNDNKYSWFRLEDEYAKDGGHCFYR